MIDVKRKNKKRPACYEWGHTQWIGQQQFQHILSDQIKPSVVPIYNISTTQQQAVSLQISTDSGPVTQNAMTALIKTTYIFILFLN